MWNQFCWQDEEAQKCVACEVVLVIGEEDRAKRKVIDHLVGYNVNEHHPVYGRSFQIN